MSSVLVTGGTGSFGQALVRRLLAGDVGRVVVFSRDELKQWEMRQAGLVDERLRYFIGDVRDLQRLRRAMFGVDVVVHAAALKQVDSCEYNPQEAVKTNVDGTANVIEAALDGGVGRVLMIGTDKAVDPVNLYGATKLTAEKLIVDANAYGGNTTRFASTRYGNVITSRGAVLPRFLTQHMAGEPFTVTDPTMTRFVLTLDQAIDFVLSCLERMRGAEVFVPRLPSVTVDTIARAVAWPSATYDTDVVGVRPGEKHDELLISRNEPLLAEANGLPCPYGSSTIGGDRLGVDGFRRLAGLGATLEATA